MVVKWWSLFYGTDLNGTVPSHHFTERSGILPHDWRAIIANIALSITLFIVARVVCDLCLIISTDSLEDWETMPTNVCPIDRLTQDAAPSSHM